jgi:hypothetical protein
VDTQSALWILVPLAVVHLVLSRRRGALAFQVLLDVTLLAMPLRHLGSGAHLGPGVDWAVPWGAPPTVSGSPEQADLPVQFAVWWQEVRRLAADGQPPWISDRMGGGTPLYAHGQTGLPFPLHLPVWALGSERGTDVMAVWKLELAALGAYFLARRLGVGAAAAAAGALACSFGLFTISWLVVPLAWVIAGTPWAFYWLVGALRGRRSAAAALALLLGCLAGWSVHPESAAFLMLAVAAGGMTLAWGRRRRLLRLVAPIVLACGVAGVGAVPTLLAIADSAKLAAAREQPPYPMPELTLGTRLRAAALVLVPWREGHPADGTWHWPFAAAAVSIAVGTVPIALIAAAQPRRRHRRFATALAVVGVAAAALLYQAPGVSEVAARVPVLGWMVWPRAAFLIPFALATGFALAADAWLRRPRPGRLVVTALALQAIVVALAASSASVGGRAHVVLPAALPGALAVAAPLLAPSAGWLLPGLLAVESLALTAALLPVSAPAAATPPRVAALQRLVDVAPGRIVGLGGALPPNLAAAAGLADLRSHEPMRPRSLALLHRALGSDGDDLPGPLQRPWSGVCGAWGVRWLVAPASGLPAAAAFSSGWVEAGGAEGARFYRNARWLPVTRLATRAIPPPGDPREGAWEGVSFADTAVLAAPPQLGGGGTIEVIAAAPSRVVASVRADGTVLALHHAPLTAGWTATVDGRPAPLLHANLGAMAVAVGAGEHEVRFAYAPAGLRLGAVLTVAGLAGCVALAFGRRRRWR